MRDALAGGVGKGTASHFGHAYQRMAPKPKNGKTDTECHNQWLCRCEKIVVSVDYQHFFAKWLGGFVAGEARPITAGTRLLIGHGNPSGSDVGLTVHHTWGVPMIPGSALKGLLAHYVDATYGGTDTERRPWRAATWTGRRVLACDAAGPLFGALFGAPAVEERPDSARMGAVVFHDALYVPASATCNRPYRRDVTTVHQRGYYNTQGRAPPTDWDSPNPIGYISVRPDTSFLLALTGPESWRTLAMELLLVALAEWGVGAKTSSGYGRFS